jgi:hypothetical protein
LWQWQPIVFTLTDYAALPPKIREGQVATIFSFDNRASTIQALLSDGQFAMLSPQKFPWFRSAFALSIREARQLNEQTKLRIEIGDAGRIWAALILAAKQKSALVTIDRLVARNASALAIALGGTLPGALPTDLYVTPDWNAELSTEVARWTDSFEELPEPAAPVPNEKLAAPRIHIADNVRELLASDEHAARAFQLLCELLHPKNGLGEEVAAKLQTRASSLTMHIVHQLREAYRPSTKSAKEEDDPDTPRKLRLQSPQPWTAGDLSELKADLFFMTLRGSNLDIASIAASRGLRRSGRADPLKARQSSASLRLGSPRTD